jgi:hypothetical protein
VFEYNLSVAQYLNLIGKDIEIVGQTLNQVVQTYPIILHRSAEAHS